MHMCVKDIAFTSLYRFSVEFWKCSDTVVFVVLFWK